MLNKNTQFLSTDLDFINEEEVDAPKTAAKEIIQLADSLGM